jgi:hypothetical protein
LICENVSCDFRTRSLKSNETEWIGIANHYFSLGHIPLSNSTVIFRTCRRSSTCLNLCNSQIYYVLGSEDLSHACIHLGVHSHPVAHGQCRESLEAINRLIAHEVAKVPSTMFLHSPISLKFGMFLLVPTLPILKSLSLKKLGSTYNPSCPFPLNDFSPCLGILTCFVDLSLTNTRQNNSFSSEWQTNLSKS